VDTQAVANEHSTCEWVDEAYSKRLWGQLLRRVDNQPAGARRSLLTVRRSAIDVWKGRSNGQVVWGAALLVPGPGRALDFVVVRYSRDGRFECDQVLLRISGHAGERLFERLRTNSDEDLLDTVTQALVVVIKGGAVNAGAWRKVHPHHAGLEVLLSWGSLFMVPDDGLWVSTTFIPGATK